MSALKRMMRVSNRSLIAFIFFFSLSTSCLYFIYVAPGIANTYLFMVQARGIMLRENVKTIGHMIRLYTNKNTTLNGTGRSLDDSDALRMLEVKDSLISVQSDAQTSGSHCG